MFTIKATYNNETRRFTVQESFFPSFESIQNQLYRVFPIRGSYYLSRLMFCPSEGSRVIVGKEIHNEAQYNEHIAPFSGRLWPNGMLRFNVVDEIPHKPPFATSTTQVQSESSLASNLARPIPRRPPPQMSNSSAYIEVDNEWSATAGSNRHSMHSQMTRQSCCSIAESKEKVKELMSNFLRDFNNVMSSTFGDNPAQHIETSAVSSSPETIVPEQKNTDDTGDVNIPGAFVQPARSLDVPEPAGKPVHVGISCDHCGVCIRGVRFKCQTCSDFDLCEDCVSQRYAKSVHQAEHALREGLALHSFLEIAKPGDPITAATEPESASNERTSELPVHMGVICDLCDDTIIGTRHKCLDCHNFDLCDNCFSRSDALHPNHEFVSFKTPRRIIILRLPEGNETPRVNLPRFSVDASSTEVHNANCDLCDSRIRGIRYKCLSCPDYDVCSSCYRIVPEQHPKHTFVKLTTPQVLSPRDPSTYRRHGALCNECGATIRGIRYKCLHPECTDYDLCSNCEALPIEVHPPLHPLVKLRSPDVVIPTVYRVGGTTLIEPQLPRQAETAVVAVETDPAPTLVDVAVHAEGIVEKTDAAVATSPVAEEFEPLSHSVSMPILPTPPSFAPGTSSQTIQQFVDLWWDESSRPNDSVKGFTKEAAQIPADLPTFPSLFSAFAAKNTPRQDSALRATFVSDINVEDGQVFPAGAEFVKCWRMRNDGECAWPETTCVIFIAGNRMPAYEGSPLSYHVGKVEGGATVDVSVYDIKAPEIPGKYVGYWRLSDGTEPFGQSVWCEISVPIPSAPSRESLSASEVVMPELSRVKTASIDLTNEEAVPDLVPSTWVPVTPTMSGPSTDIDSTDSLLDDFDATSDEDWDALREASGHRTVHHADAEYIVLYDEQSTDDEGH